MVHSIPGQIKLDVSDTKLGFSDMKSGYSDMKLVLFDIQSYMLCTKDWLVMQQGLVQYLEKQYAQSHSDMLVMRGVEHIHLGQCVREGIEHIQYPRLHLSAMEV